MSRRKSSLLFAAVAGVLCLAQALAVVLVAQVDWRAAGPLVVALAGFALLLWTVLLATVLVAGAQHLLALGLAEAHGRVEQARRCVHASLLAVAPTVELLGKALRRQEAPLGELRDALLACAVAGKPGLAAVNGARFARAAGLAAGVLRMQQDNLRLAAVLEDWVDVARIDQDELRIRTLELRERLEQLPASSGGEGARPAPVFGYGLADNAPAAADDPWAELPEALQERLRGSSSRWRDDGEAEPGRN